MKKKILLIGIIILMLVATGCKNQANITDGDIVTFKDDSLNITANNLYDILKEKYGTSFLIDMIDRKILDQEYEDSDEIKEYVNIQVKSIKNYYSSESEFLDYIADYGYKNEEELKEYLNLNYKRNLMTYDYIKDILNDSEIKKYYEDNISGDITGSHILIEVKTDNSMTEDDQRKVKDEALAKANEALEKLNSGVSFAEVAKEYSEDSLTNNSGGNMGTFNLLETDDVTRQSFNNLEVDKYSSQPIETEYGYEIFYKNAESDKPEFESVKSKIIKILSDEKLNSESTLQYKALINIREKYGINIVDEDLAVYYENAMNNLMKKDNN